MKQKYFQKEIFHGTLLHFPKAHCWKALFSNKLSKRDSSSTQKLPVLQTFQPWNSRKSNFIKSQIVGVFVWLTFFYCQQTANTRKGSQQYQQTFFSVLFKNSIKVFLSDLKDLLLCSSFLMLLLLLFFWFKHIADFLIKEICNDIFFKIYIKTFS